MRFGDFLRLFRQASKGAVSSLATVSAQDPTNVTYNTDGSVNTFALNGVTWTMSYNADGTPNQATAGGYTKTYTYSNGRFQGITGAVNVGEARSGAWASRPAIAAPGDRYFVTDMGDGFTVVFDGTRWRPTGPVALSKKYGTFAAPATNILNSTNGAGNTLFTWVDGVPIVLPANFLYQGQRFRWTYLQQRANAVATITYAAKIGNNNTFADDNTAVSSGMTAATSTSMRMAVDLWVPVVSGNTATFQSTNQEGFSGQSATPNEFTVASNSPVYFNLGTAAITSTDTAEIVWSVLEWMP